MIVKNETIHGLGLGHALQWVAGGGSPRRFRHLVQVEATASAVNQGELAVGLLALLGVAIYLKARETGRLGAGSVAGLGGLCRMAALFKENLVLSPPCWSRPS